MSFKSQKLQSAPNGEVFSVVFQVQLGCEEIKRLLAEADPPGSLSFACSACSRFLRRQPLRLPPPGCRKQRVPKRFSRQEMRGHARYVSWVPATASVASQEATSISVKARIDNWHQKPQFCSLAGGQAGQLDPCPSAMLS